MSVEFPKEYESIYSTDKMNHTTIQEVTHHERRIPKRI